MMTAAAVVNENPANFVALADTLASFVGGRFI